MKSKYFNHILGLLVCVLVLSACEEEEYALPVPKSGLQNDVIKRSIGPNIVGQEIEFAYAMAILPSEGRITSARVEASIAGASGTWLEHRGYYTDGSGNDIGVEMGAPATTEGAVSQLTFTTDTCAATLRYYYRIPEEARGKAVSFTFSATADNGQTVSYEMGPYNISNMDVVLDKVLVDNAACYISIEDMEVYDAATAATIPDKIDLVYLFRNVAGKEFLHALVAPSTDDQYKPGVALPAGVDNRTKIRKVWALRDRHLDRGQYGVYIDDVDFQQLDVSTAPDFAINMKAEAGVWVETEDGRYRAYIYVNSVNNGGTSMTVSIKRLQMN